MKLVWCDNTDIKKDDSIHDENDSIDFNKRENKR